MPDVTPAQLVEQRRQAILNHDAAAFTDLFATDSVIEAPFAGPALPGRISGQRAIRQMFARLVDSPIQIDELETTALYQTNDPEVVIVEITTKGRIASAGQSFATSHIQVFRIRDGKIVLFRDYFNPAGLAEHLDG
jgi:uncharacterized protein